MQPFMRVIQKDNEKSENMSNYDYSKPGEDDKKWSQW
jgi:hypothetical protein